jgi:ferrochelatase
VSVGVLVMAYGTPSGPDDVLRYYTDIRRGRPPSPDQLTNLQSRYDAIGGTFPLAAITAAQVARLTHALGETHPVQVGYKHSAPSIEQAVHTLESEGATAIVGLVLAPHYAAASVGEYARRAAAVATVPIETIESWHLLPEYLDFLAAATAEAQDALPEHVRRDAEVVFTAHSLPERAVPPADPYPDQVMATAEAVATLTDLFRWSTAWQSAGRTDDAWLGPDVLDVIRARAEAGAVGIVVCACGFVADHLEVAYDLDVEAAAVAREAGLPYARTRSLNDDPTVFAALAALVRERAESAHRAHR